MSLVYPRQRCVVDRFDRTLEVASRAGPSRTVRISEGSPSKGLLPASKLISPHKKNPSTCINSDMECFAYTGQQRAPTPIRPRSRTARSGDRLRRPRCLFAISKTFSSCFPGSGGLNPSASYIDLGFAQANTLVRAWNPGAFQHWHSPLSGWA